MKLSACAAPVPAPGAGAASHSQALKHTQGAGATRQCDDAGVVLAEMLLELALRAWEPAAPALEGCKKASVCFQERKTETVLSKYFCHCPDSYIFCAVKIHTYKSL